MSNPLDLAKKLYIGRPLPGDCTYSSLMSNPLAVLDLAKKLYIGRPLHAGWVYTINYMEKLDQYKEM